MPKILFTTFLFLAFLPSAFAQKVGYKTVQDLAAFQRNFNTATAKVQTLQSNFIQTKNLALLAEKVISRGQFSLRKQDKVRIEYTTPFSYLLIMNGSQILIKDEQKTSTVNAGSSKMLQSVNRIMLDCMRGTVFSNPDFKTVASEGSGGFLLTLTPANASISKLFRQIEVYLDKSNYDVQKLIMTEKNADYTEMKFTGIVHNPNLSETLFKVR